MTPQENYALLGSIPIRKCDGCGEDYLRSGSGYYCGACKAVRRGATAYRGVPPGYHRVRVVAPHSSRCGKVGIGRELATRWDVRFDDGRVCSFCRNAVEVLE